jgi:hypothetical protein
VGTRCVPLCYATFVAPVVKHSPSQTRLTSPRAMSPALRPSHSPLTHLAHFGSSLPARPRSCSRVSNPINVHCKPQKSTLTMSASSPPSSSPSIAKNRYAGARASGMMMITVAKTTSIWKTKLGLMLELLPPNRFDRCLKRNLAAAFESVNKSERYGDTWKVRRQAGHKSAARQLRSDQGPEVGGQLLDS